MNQNEATADYGATAARFNEMLRVQNSFDMVSRQVCPKGRQVTLWFVDGLCRGENTEKIVSAMNNAAGEAATAEAFAAAFVTFSEVRVVTDLNEGVKGVLEGAAALLVNGLTGLILVDLRIAPVRGVDEPQSDRVLRGPHDGFVESLAVNAALIRRRIRVPELTMELWHIGEISQSDVVLCYLENTVKQRDLKILKSKLKGIRVDSLTMNQQSLLECLTGKQYYNPFPKVRYTERPDCAAAAVLEGGIVIMMENTPVTMLIPTGLFDFLQDTNDFYLLPFVGTYIRLVRVAIILLTLLLIPCWYLLVSNPQWIPPGLDFLRIEEPNTVPVFAQLIIVEMVVDALKLASINTPSALNNSFSVLGALVLGEFAVSSGWFVPEVVLYMAFVAVTDFAQPNVEFGYTIKLQRIMLLVLIRLFSLWGLAAGLIVIIVSVLTARTVTERCYLYPLIPFDGKKLLSLFIRQSVQAKQKTGKHINEEMPRG